jgi:hypothetical protein
MRTLTLYVPKPNTPAAATVHPGSAIVGDEAARTDGAVLCHFEGGHDGGEKWSYFLKMKHAAGRLIERYPTIAMAAFRVDDLVPVGTVDGERYVVTMITDEASLTAWAGESAEQVIGRRLPAGPSDWDVAAAICQPEKEARPIGSGFRNGYAWYKTQAGQVLRFSVGPSEREVLVFEFDDANVPSLLAATGIGTRALSFVVGKSAAETVTAAAG